MWADIDCLLEGLIAAKPSFAGGLEQLFAYCKLAAPEYEQLWTALRQLDYKSDIDRLTAWIRDVLTEEPPDATINSLWFGLVNWELSDGLETTRLYIGGSATFDPSSPSNEFVCSLVYRPQSAYADSHILTTIYRRMAATSDEGIWPLGEPLLCHGYVALVLINWLDGPVGDLMLGDAAYRAVVFGHDEGSTYRLDVLQRGGAVRDSK
jgi:hypothetical protein